MAGNPFFSGRIPKELNESVVKHCEETGKTKTDILIAALSAYLNVPTPQTNTKISSSVEKELTDLRERMQQLEETVYKTFVINSDNSDDKEVLVTVIPQSNNPVINVDNNVDNKIIKEDTNSKTNNENDTIASKEIKSNDNSPDNNDKTDTLDFIKLETKEVTEISNISTTQMGRHKNTAFEEAKKQGYSIEPDIKFTTSIEVTQKKDILIKDKKYRLFCTGTNDKNKPIWNLIYDDNNSYQGDILF